MADKKKYEFSSAPDEEYLPEALPPRVFTWKISKRRRLKLLLERSWFRWARWYFYYRAQWAVRGYPVYRPPHLKNERDLTLLEARENFEHFMRTKPARLETLAALVEKFGVSLNVDDSGLRQMSDWFDCYGPFLVPFLRDRHSLRNPFRTFQLPGKSADLQFIRSFDGYDPLWDDDYVGPNVLFDFGTYVGECLIFRDPELYWDVYDKYYESVDYQKPWIVNPKYDLNEGAIIFSRIRRNIDWLGVWRGQPTKQRAVGNANGWVERWVKGAAEYDRLRGLDPGNTRVASNKY